MKLKKIISGGQTGVDRAALDAALERGFPCGGWCPKGRRAEDGPIDPRYPLKEMPTAEYAARTEKNVRAADGTLVLVQGAPAGGTALTIDLAARLAKPYLVVDLDKSDDISQVRDWLTANHIGVLNVAGPRERLRPGIYQEALEFLCRLLATLPIRKRQSRPAARSGKRRSPP